MHVTTVSPSGCYYYCSFNLSFLLTQTMPNKCDLYFKNIFRSISEPGFKTAQKESEWDSLTGYLSIILYFLFDPTDQNIP